MFILYFIKQVWMNKRKHGNLFMEFTWKTLKNVWFILKSHHKDWTCYSGIIQHFHPKYNFLFLKMKDILICSQVWDVLFCIKWSLFRAGKR